MKHAHTAPQSIGRRAAVTITISFLLTIPQGLQARNVPILQPGLPGESSRLLTAEEAVNITDTSYSPDDVAFMRGMIPHHEQALEMAVLVAQRTNLPELGDIAGRIKASQSDEIEFMQGWLADRGETASSMSMTAQHASHDGDGVMHPKMKGMASPEQMAQLAASESTAFDRLFLKLMISHHEGAVEMVEDLLDQPGSAYDPVLYEFIGDVKNDQLVEIERMHALLVTLSDDPRANLTAGLYDAGIAIKNLRLISTQTKPPGFIDPKNPRELPKEKPPEDAEKSESQTGEVTENAAAESADKAKPTEGKDGRYAIELL